MIYVNHILEKPKLKRFQYKVSVHVHVIGNVFPKTYEDLCARSENAPKIVRHDCGNQAPLNVTSKWRKTYTVLIVLMANSRQILAF